MSCFFKWNLYVPLKSAGMKSYLYSHGTACIQMAAFNGDPGSSRQWASGGMDSGEVRRLKRDTQVEGKGSIMGSSLQKAALNTSKSFVLGVLRLQSLPQKWRPWLRLLCSQDEYSPSHTPQPEPPAPCNPLRHSADTQSCKGKHRGGEMN